MSVSIDLSGKTAVVTGASRGIGKEIALLLGASGAAVVAAYRTGETEAKAVVDRISRRGSEASTCRCDVGNVADVEQLFTHAVRTHGGVDILINNAGIWKEAGITTMSEEELAETLQVNLNGAIYCAQEAARRMSGRKWGRIISISSTAALLGEPRHSHYAASKGALESFTKSAAVELAGHGITVNCVAPGWTLTEMTASEIDTERGRKLLQEIPLGKIATSEEVAWAVLHLASKQASHTTGVTLRIDGGYSIRR